MTDEVVLHYNDGRRHTLRSNVTPGHTIEIIDFGPDAKGSIFDRWTLRTFLLEGRSIDDPNAWHFGERHA